MFKSYMQSSELMRDFKYLNNHYVHQGPAHTLDWPLNDIIKLNITSG